MSGPPQHLEARRALKGWYQDVSNRPPTPARVIINRVTWEKEDLYQRTPTWEPTLIDVIPSGDNNDVLDEEEIVGGHVKYALQMIEWTVRDAGETS